MAKRSREETEEEKKERKRAKKELKKKRKSQESNQDTEDVLSNTASPTPAATTTAVDGEPSALPDPTSTTKAKKVVSNKSSCQRKTIRMIFSLYPSDLDDIQKEIKRSLRHKLLKYVPGIEGVLLAYDNVKIVSNGGRTAGVILNEQPQIHYHADLDTLLFTPAKDMQLKGTVTECFQSHVGLLVHNFFNASITADHLVSAGFSFESGEWVNEDGSTLITAEEQVHFTVAKVHECAGTISMEGMDPSVTYAI